MTSIDSARPRFRLRFGRIEIFIVVLFLLNGVLLLPGTQPFRFAVRAAPFALSLLALCRPRRAFSFPPGSFLLRLALILLVLGLFHPRAQPASAVAQLLFQAAIAAPAFWAAGLVRDARHLVGLLWLVFLCNLVGSTAGLLQIYFPDRFLPAAFSSAASANWLDSLTFVNPAGRLLVRPPGLSDLPGGAALSGAMTAILGFGFSSLHSGPAWRRLFCLSAASAGFAVLYLTQVRSLTLMTLFALGLLATLALARRTLFNRAWIVLAGSVLLLASFGWAVGLGGDKVRDRFLDLSSGGMVASYDASRGWFWRYTFTDALAQYPLGAGPGRWGMMSVYFGQNRRPDSPPLWAEIQLTGWLFDGGVPMWLLYGGALLSSMLFLYRLSRSTRYGRPLAFAATLALCLDTAIAGASFSGPTFNTAMGLQFWLLLALVYGAARRIASQLPTLEPSALALR